MQIDADTPIEELVAELPASVRILRQRGLVCIRCGEPFWGTLGELAASKGISDLGPILEELRAAAAHPIDQPSRGVKREE